MCEKYVLSVIADVACRELTRDDFQEIIDQAATKSVADHVRRCLTGLLGAGLEEGHILAGRDLLRGVRWSGDGDADPEPVDRAVTREEIPAADAVHTLAREAAETPTGVDLAGMVERRLGELERGDLMFPAPRGNWLRRSNYSRAVWDPAAHKVDWPKADNGRWFWTFHSLRHVFATWALHDAGIPIEDLSRLMGHSSTRATQDIYVHVRDDMLLRYCLLHVAGMIVRTGRQTKLRLAHDWPWTDALIAAFDRLQHRPARC